MTTDLTAARWQASSMPRQPTAAVPTMLLVVPHCSQLCLTGMIYQIFFQAGISRVTQGSCYGADSRHDLLNIHVSISFYIEVKISHKVKEENHSHWFHRGGGGGCCSGISVKQPQCAETSWLMPYKNWGSFFKKTCIGKGV